MQKNNNTYNTILADFYRDLAENAYAPTEKKIPTSPSVGH